MERLSMSLKLVRDGKYNHKVLFDCELIGHIRRLSDTKYVVEILVGRTAGEYQHKTFAACLADLTMRNWRSVVGMSALRTLPPRKYEPKRPRVTKKRWSYV
jgi:hypothetical protein